MKWVAKNHPNRRIFLNWTWSTKKLVIFWSPIFLRTKNLSTHLRIEGEIPWWNRQIFWVQKIPRWWFQTFLIFTPIWWRFPIWAYFSDGLVQPPTRSYWRSKNPFVPGSFDRYVKKSAQIGGGFLGGEFRHKFYTQEKDPGIWVFWYLEVCFPIRSFHIPGKAFEFSFGLEGYGFQHETRDLRLVGA